MKNTPKLENYFSKRDPMLRSLLIALCLVTGIALKAQLPRELYVSDTRNGDSLPSAYKHIARFDFKNRTIIHAPGSSFYNGLFTLAPWSDASGGLSYQMSFDQSGLYLRQGNYTSNAWTAWKRLVIENSNGLTVLGNGDTATGLNVNGKIKTKVVNVTLTGWADDVFDKGYPLPTLKELDRQIKKSGRLPDMPSTREVLENGLDLGEMNRKLLRKIEELTLYIIQQQNEIDKKMGI